MFGKILSAGREFLSDGESLSAMRLMCVLTCLTGLGATIYGLVVGRDLSGLAMLTTALITPALGCKAIQAHFETRGNL